MRKVYEEILKIWGYENIPELKKPLIYEVMKQNVIVASNYRDLLNYVFLDEPKEERLIKLCSLIVDYDEYEFDIDLDLYKDKKIYFYTKCIREVYSIIYKEVV